MMSRFWELMAKFVRFVSWFVCKTFRSIAFNLYHFNQELKCQKPPHNLHSKLIKILQNIKKKLISSKHVDIFFLDLHFHSQQFHCSTDNNKRFGARDFSQWLFVHFTFLFLRKLFLFLFRWIICLNGSLRVQRFPSVIGFIWRCISGGGKLD